MKTWFEAGHVAIVTGGSQGLGKELALSLLERGLSVIIDARDELELRKTAEQLRPCGDLVAIPGDVADRSHVHELVRIAKERYGRLDLLVNNASTLGTAPLPLLQDMSPATLARIFDVNLFAPIHLIQHALPLLRAADLATIVNITSDAGVEGYPSWGGYGSSKAALEHVSRVLAAELDGTNIRVLVADPGDMNTAMHHAALPDADPQSLRDPREVAQGLLAAIAAMQTPFERQMVKVTERARA